MGLNRETLQFICSMEFWRMAVFWTISLIFSYFQLLLNALSPSSPSSYPRRSPDPSTKPICIITGASSGLGASAARYLSREGYYVILAGRSSYLLSKTIQDIKQQQEDSHLKAFQVDLSSFQSILKFKSSVEQWILDNDLHPSVQLLINNAGILATSYRVTAEGFDQMMATNYIGPFALTSLLLPLLKNSPSPSRIVNVTSFTHRCVSNNQLDEERLSGKYLKHGSKVDQYPLAHIYEYSKFCVLLFSYELHRRLWLTDPSHQISVLAADPGAVKTSIMREVPPHVAQLAYTSLRYMGLLKSPESGIDSVIDAALAPPEASGLYFFGGKGRTLKSSTLSYDAKLAEKLWSSSCELLREVQLVL
ncbi:dehydrogenase/reductase SDR family member on chromosome X [Cinnamomum micranthum f. kanehirae]|uniref:Dehydrogenase/reductase SDR family member on chromosome X n=1 Tax=Cinnamomum micranthum f. kanehirae TaxID=337451 RepID=A0A3S3N489_9MAGN|nr:dehydrogenase/reductase SDR family member on chromosome X [Cinnamomum micranthum f. kanehirae]